MKQSSNSATETRVQDPRKHPFYFPHHEPMDGWEYLEQGMVREKGDEYICSGDDAGSKEDHWEPIPKSLIGEPVKVSACIYRRRVQQSQPQESPVVGADSGGHAAPDGAVVEDVNPSPAAVLYSMTTQSGDEINLLRPEDSIFSIWDIAHSLSHTCRFAGQCDRFYSVAEHSVYVSDLVRHRHPVNFAAQLRALLHDAAESLLGDVPTPAKRLCPDFQKLEDRVMAAITKTFNLTTSPLDLAIIDDADHTLYKIERPQVSVWARPEDPTEITQKIQFLDPIAAENLFLNRFVTLRKLLK